MRAGKGVARPPTGRLPAPAPIGGRARAYVVAGAGKGLPPLAEVGSYFFFAMFTVSNSVGWCMPTSDGFRHTRLGSMRAMPSAVAAASP